MSDEDLLIKQTVSEAEEAAKAPQGRSGIQVPSDLRNVSLFGEVKDEARRDKTSSDPEYIEQVQAVQVPRNASPEDVASFIWLKTVQTGALKAVGSAGEVNFYPLDQFKRFVVKLSPVVGVTL